MSVKHVNYLETELVSDVFIGETSFDVVDVSGFPALGDDDWAFVSIDGEIVEINRIVGSAIGCLPLTVAHNAGASVIMKTTSELLSALNKGLEEVRGDNGSGGENSGLRLAGEDSAGHNSTGNNAIDLVRYTGGVIQYGASGEGSFAFCYGRANADGSISGMRSVTDGPYSLAIGYSCYTGADADYSVSLGYDSNTYGERSVAIGDNVNTINYGACSLGSYNRGTDTDTMFEVGIGTSDVNRLNGLEVYSNGIVVAPEAEPEVIDLAVGNTLITKEYISYLTPGGKFYSNPNLILNPEFTINQIDYDEDQTGLLPGVQIQSMWITGASTNSTSAKIGTSITATGEVEVAAANIEMKQKNNLLLSASNGVDINITVSVKTGYIYVLDQSDSSWKMVEPDNPQTVQYNSTVNSGFFALRAQLYASTFTGLKVEHADYATPFVKPSFREELEKCLFYFERIDGEYSSAHYSGYFHNGLVEFALTYRPKVSLPTISLTSQPYVDAPGEGTNSFSSVTSEYFKSKSSVRLKCPLNSSPSANDIPATVTCTGTRYFDIDARYQP